MLSQNPIQAQNRAIDGPVNITEWKKKKKNFDEKKTTLKCLHNMLLSSNIAAFAGIYSS